MNDLPQELRAGLDLFTENLRGALGENLVSVTVFGGVAKGHFNPQNSDVNVLLVLRKVALEDLDKIAVAAAVAMRVIRLRLLTLAEADLRDTAEVFSTKFLDIQRYHVVWWGRDVAGEMVLSPERLQRQARRELMNLQLRLRQVYLESGQRPELLEALLKRSGTGLLINLGVLLELKTGRTCADFEAVMQLASGHGFDVQELKQIREMKRQTELHSDLKAAYQTLVRVVETALDVQQ